MAEKDNLEIALRAVEQAPTMYRNFYKHCGEMWEDVWDCMCNDKCPVCNKEIEPYESEEIIDEDQTIIH